MCSTKIQTFFPPTFNCIFRAFRTFLYVFFWYTWSLRDFFFLKIETIELGNYMFFIISRSWITEKCRVVDVIAPVIECVFCLPKVAGSWCPLPYNSIKRKKKPCHPYHLPIAWDIHIHHFQLMPRHIQCILLQCQAGTKLFVQQQHSVSVHDDAITNW